MGLPGGLKSGWMISFGEEKGKARYVILPDIPSLMGRQKGATAQAAYRQVGCF
jgi:hypothetical protein